MEQHFKANFVALEQVEASRVRVRERPRHPMVAVGASAQRPRDLAWQRPPDGVEPLANAASGEALSDDSTGRPDVREAPELLPEAQKTPSPKEPQREAEAGKSSTRPALSSPLEKKRKS